MHIAVVVRVIAISIYKTVGGAIFRLIVSVEEPSFDGVPINVLWICMDQNSPLYNVVTIRTSKAVDLTNGTRNTWQQIGDPNLLYSSPQVYDLAGSMLLGELLPTNSIPGASNTIDGITFLTIMPVNPNDPLAVGDNDPRMSDARTPNPHTHALMPSTQILTPTGAINLTTSTQPVAGNVLIVGTTGANAIWRSLVPSDIVGAPIILESLSITGPTALFETDTGKSYTANATFDVSANNGPVVPDWSITNQDPSDTTVYATIDVNGNLSINTGAAATGNVFVNASYTFNGVTAVTSIALTITHVSIPTGLQITGVNSIESGGQAAYVATATYNDGTQAVVIPVWTLSNVAPGATATIDGTGMLTATSIPATFIASVNASYTQGNVTVTASNQVSLTAVPITLTSIVINGPASVSASSFTQYSVTATMSDGSTNVPTTGVTWEYINWCK